MKQEPMRSALADKTMQVMDDVTTIVMQVTDDAHRITTDAHDLRRYVKDLDLAEEAVNLLIDSIARSLACGEAVTIRNFGKFEPRVRPAVTRKNPLTGEPIDVPEKLSVGFVPAPALKARLNPQLDKVEEVAADAEPVEQVRPERPAPVLVQEV